jgi:hypothetical protein
VKDAVRGFRHQKGLPKIAFPRSCKLSPKWVGAAGRHLRLAVRGAVGDIQTTFAVRLLDPTSHDVCHVAGQQRWIDTVELVAFGNRNCEGLRHFISDVRH